ncbi:MAG: geranylgeranylglycerol-phosphate geranylgeranyltransferase [Methanobacteriota archaeon]
MKTQTTRHKMEDETISLSTSLELVRPLNCLFTGVAVIIGAVVTFGGPDVQWVVLAPSFAAAALVAAGGNAINDYYDREIDGINRPERPIPSGRMNAKTARNIAGLLFVIGISLTVFLNLYCFALAALNSLVLTLYAWRLKRKGLSGNIAIGYLVGSSFLFGGLATISTMGRAILPNELLVLVLMAALSTVGRELIKAIQDMQGDQKLGLRTFPLTHGAGKAAVVSAIFIAAAIVLSPLPYLLGIFGWYYLATVAISIAAFIAAVMIIAYSQERMAAKRASLACKVGMGLGLLAFLLGALA